MSRPRSGRVARLERSGAYGTLVCEIRSVNHRFLDATVRLPDSCRALESDLRNALSKELRRVVPLLRQHGLTVEFDRSREGCSITFKYKEPPEDDDFAQFWRGTEPTQSTDRV